MLYNNICSDVLQKIKSRGAKYINNKKVTIYFKIMLNYLKVTNYLKNYKVFKKNI